MQRKSCLIARGSGFCSGLVNPVLNLPKGQVKLFGKFKLQNNCNQCCSSKLFRGC